MSDLDKIKIVQGDITKLDVGAIVTLVPQDLEYKGSLNKSILDAAGAALDDFILEHIVQPKIGDVYTVPGFDLPCQHIIVCVVPVWRTEFDRQDRQLLNVCRKAVEQASDMRITSIAIPPLATGRKGFPLKRGVRLILQGIAERLDDRLDAVYVVSNDERHVSAFEDKLYAMKHG